MNAKTLVFNGWAAGPETWDLCEFPHDWVFDYVEQLDGLPERVIDDSDSVTLVGFSMGGTTALRMLLRTPQKVRGMVLVSATARMMEDPETGWHGMSQRRRVALKLGTTMTFRDDPSPTYAEPNLDRGLDYLQRVDLRRELLALPADIRNRSRVAIFQSERDGIVRPQNAVFLKEVFANAVVTMVPGSEHVLPITIPEAIDAAVMEMQED